MGSPQRDSGLRVHTGADYRIKVRGFLDADWSNRLGGLAITCEADPMLAGNVTTLEGRVLDQAALLGILNVLYDLQLPLISVECLAVT